MSFFKYEALEFIKITEEEANLLTGSEIVEVYNKLASALDQKSVNRFATKKAAIERLGKISKQYEEKFPSVEEEKSKKVRNTVAGRGAVEPYPTKDGFLPDAEALRISKVTRANPFAGSQIFDLTGGDNPRRPICSETNEPARAWLCFNIIINAGIKGISFEDYIASGGNLRDLHHDQKHGRVLIAGAE
jgi:hypothetical protein